MGGGWSQLFPPEGPALTEANLPDQKDKVFLVTGGYGGVGFELCRMLYQAGGKVYIGGRSQSKFDAAVAQIKALPGAKPGGDLKFLALELDDLSTIKPAVEKMSAAEKRLDVLFLNAGVSQPASGSVGKQGHDLTMVTNCYGHQLLAQLLIPLLVETARNTTSGAVRVVWTSSIVAEVSSPVGGMTDAQMNSANRYQNYITSKTGNWFLAKGLADQVGKDGVLSVAQNPGNLKTDILRHIPRIIGWVLAPAFYHAKYGAYTELWAGLSPDLVIEDGGKFISPWGRLHPHPRQDLLDAMRTEEEGGTGRAALFVEHCNKQIKDFL